ncbi:MAG: anthranilate synthase component I [Pseudomonadota bacterium]|nr:anthranilate synthase component I [Pseudomonadota bacterium]MDE3038300.1 anthranilate synthase component I [Pseudomonadota bacterium]
MQNAPVIQPSPELFNQRFAHGLSQLVWTSRPADLDTPVSAMLRLMEKDRPCFLLESVEKGEIRGRYSVIGLMPDIIWRCTAGKAEICYHETFDAARAEPCEGDALTSLRALYEASKIDIPDGLPPMAAGLVGHMNYDMARLMEKLPGAKPDVIGIPDACFIRPKLMVIFDAVCDTMFIITTIWADAERTDAAAAYNAARKRIRHVLDKLESPLPAGGRQEGGSPVKMSDFGSNTTRARYDHMIAAAKEHIKAGDIFQVVLSQRFSAPFALPPFALYRALRCLNPSPFLFYLYFGDYTLVGSSPEILVRLLGSEVTIRPIAGTRKRGRDRAEDEWLAKDLLADPKEISEHLMLLDLGRNDVGRVAKVGSVKTTQRMTIENYSHVMHIVSNVVGEIDPKYNALSALVAGFPAGTVSGAPKIRAMEIIDELEPERRSFYGGCIGYFSAGGNMETAITLRTGLIKDGKLYIQAGGGIVAESEAEAEYQESLNKARALMRAAEEAIKFT